MTREHPTHTPFFRSCLLWGLAFGILETAYFTRANQVFPFSLGHFNLAALLTLGHGALAWLGGTSLARLPGLRDRATARLLGAPWILCTILAVSHYRDRINTRPRRLEGSLATLAAIAAVSLLFAGIYRLACNHKSGRRRVPVQASAGALALIGLLWLGSARPEPIPEPPKDTVTAEEIGGADDTGLRVMVVPLDGGTWEIIDPMMARGELPTFKALVDRGLSANLQTDLPTYSPIIWTSIATGKLPIKHGVQGFTKTRSILQLPELRHETKRIATLTKLLKYYIRATERFIPLTGELYSSNDVKARPLWDLADEFDMASVVLEWYVSHPAQPLKGVLVSERFHLMKGVASDVPNIVYPDSLTPEIEAAVLLADEIPDEPLYAMLDTSGLDAAGRKTLMEHDPRWFDTIRKNLARDLSTAALAEAILPKVPDWRFAGLYFRAMDAIHHYTWLRKDLPAEDLDANLDRRFRTAVEGYYRICDELLARVTRFADDRTVIMVVSDHGFESHYDHERAPEGFFIMAGGPTRRTSERQNISIYDIAPTSLTLLGIPVPDDMDGRVAAEMISEEFWNEFPPRRVASYEHPGRRRDTLPTTAMDDEVLDRLRALGYIN